MKINLQSLKFSAKNHLKEFVVEKVSKLERYYDKILAAEVTLTLEDEKHIENKACDIRLVIPGNDILVKRNAASFEEAILKTVETVQNQLQRRKDKNYSDISATIG